MKISIAFSEMLLLGLLIVVLGACADTGNSDSLVALGADLGGASELQDEEDDSVTVSSNSDSGGSAQVSAPASYKPTNVAAPDTTVAPIIDVSYDGKPKMPCIEDERREKVNRLLVLIARKRAAYPENDREDDLSNVIILKQVPLGGWMRPMDPSVQIKVSSLKWGLGCSEDRIAIQSIVVNDKNANGKWDKDEPVILHHVLARHLGGNQSLSGVIPSLTEYKRSYSEGACRPVCKQRGRY